VQQNTAWSFVRYISSKRQATVTAVPVTLFDLQQRVVGQLPGFRFIGSISLLFLEVLNVRAD